MSLKQKIGNIIQCRIDIAEQDKETAIMRELMVLKRELLETMNEATKQIERKFIYTEKLRNPDEILTMTKRKFVEDFNQEIREVLAVLEGEKKQ
jgi:hypothetical protein